MVRRSDGNSGFFIILSGVLPRDTFASYLFIRGQDYVLRISIDLIKENEFSLKMANDILPQKIEKRKIRMYSDYAEDSTSCKYHTA